MYRRAVHRVSGLSHSFRERRMRVNRLDQRLHRALGAKRERGFGHQLRRPRADHVDAQHFIVSLVGHDLHEALGLAGHLRAAEHAERKRAHAHVVSALLRFLLGQPHAADFGSQ